MSDSKAKPAEGGERIFFYVLIVVASLFLLSNLITLEFDMHFVLVPFFMILASLARLKGWVKMGGPLAVEVAVSPKIRSTGRSPLAALIARIFLG